MAPDLPPEDRSDADRMDGDPADWALQFQLVTSARTGRVVVNLKLVDLTMVGDEPFVFFTGHVPPGEARDLGVALLLEGVYGQLDQNFIDTMQARGRPWEQIVNELAALRRNRAEPGR